MNVLYHHRTRGKEVEGVHIRGIVGALRQLGHRVDVVSPPGVDVDAEEKPADNGHARPTRPSPWSLLKPGKSPEMVFEGLELAYNAYAYPALNWQLYRRDYRLLYERYALFSVAGVMAARQHRLPLILEVNDSAVVDRIRPLKLQAAARRVERFVWGSADAIVTITSYFRDLIVEAGVDADRVHVVANAVAEEAFSSEPDGSEVRAKHGLDGKVVIGYVGALNHWRRIDLLLDGFAELAPKHPRAHLLLVGQGPDRDAMAERTRELGLADRVTFAGRVPHAAIAAHLGAIDIAVIPHSNTYGSPMKLFEYMAAGRAVVAPWLPPIVSIIGENDGGALFAPLDRQGLTDALDALLASPEKRRALGARAREKVFAEYLWRRHAEVILRIHEDLSRGRR